jgi:hypothetical protein
MLITVPPRRGMIVGGFTVNIGNYPSRIISYVPIEGACRESISVCLQ